MLTAAHSRICSRLFNIACGIADVSSSRAGACCRPRRLLDFGLVFLVVGAFGISMIEFWEGSCRTTSRSCSFRPSASGSSRFRSIVPNTPRKILVSSLLAASSAPLALAISAA